MSDLDGRLALVTGGSGGIGRAIALALAAEGARVAVHYASSADKAAEVVDEIVAGGGQAWAVQADLAEADACEALVTAVERLGPIDVLVANHGVGRLRSSIDEVDAAEWDRTMAINARAPFLLVRRVLPGMRERRFGRILLTSSVAGLIGGIIGPDYAASKAALHGLLHYVAGQVASDGVTINAVAPALIQDTGMLPGDPAELATRIPVGRLGTPEEVADIALALLRSGYATNHVVSIDGGMYAR
jgi:3-oxoacyl-[acyl-carrier protein] reductase